MKWWLISDEDVSAARTALQAAIEFRNERCSETGCMCDMLDPSCDEPLRDALHRLDSGLHLTNCVPADFAIARPGAAEGE